MAFSREKINKIIGKMKSKSNRNGIRESMAQVLHDILSDDELGSATLNPESAFRLVRVKNVTDNFVTTGADVQQAEEWYVIAADGIDADDPFSSKAKNYVKKDEDGNFTFETAKNADVIVFYDDVHADDVSTANVAIKEIYVYESSVWVKINARFTNYNAATSVVSGKFANAEGDTTKARGDYSHAEGFDTETTADADTAHAEGWGTLASNISAHAEGRDTTSSGDASHAEGKSTKAEGDNSHAEGNFTLALGANSSSHGFASAAQHDNSAAFGKNARVGDSDTYFGVGWSDTNFSDNNQRLASDLNLHLSVKRDGRVLNKDGKEFVTTDDIDEKLKVYSGEYADSNSITFTIQQIPNAGTPAAYNDTPTIIIEKNTNQVWVRYTDDKNLYAYLNGLLNTEIHLVEIDGNNKIYGQSITMTGFGIEMDFTAESTKGYKSRQVNGFSSSPNLNMVPDALTSTDYTFEIHSPIRQAVENNTAHIHTIEQDLIATGNANDTATLEAAKAFATDADADGFDVIRELINSGDATTLTDAKAYTDENAGGDTSHFVRVVRKEGTSPNDKDYYVENTAEITETDEYYIVNPTLPSGSTIPSTEAGKFAIKKGSTITYTTPNNGDTALIYSSGTVKKISAVLIYEGGTWGVTDSYFKNARNITETGFMANAEGSLTQATDSYAHAEGTRTNATGIASHAEGDGTRASGDNAHSEGNSTTASGENSHAEGLSTLASGINSHAQGNQTTANKSDTAIMGRNGVVGDPNTVVGVAWSNSQPSTTDKGANVDKNLIWKVDSSGNTTQTGTVKAAGFLDANNNVIGEGGDTNHFVKVVRKEGTEVGDKDYYVENVAEIVQEDEYYIVNPTVADLGDIPDANAGNFAIKASDGTITYTSPINGDTAFIYADREADDSTSENKIVAILIYEGGSWILTNSGFKTVFGVTESGIYANAEGRSTNASGAYSHAQGIFTTAEGLASHAEGRFTTAAGGDSHAQGLYTTAKTDHSTISGQNGVVANPTTLIGIAWGSDVPTDSEKTGSEDVGLVWKVDQMGNTTQDGTIKASGFLNADGTAFTGSGGGKHVNSITLDANDDDKIKLGYSDGSEGLELDWLPNPGTVADNASLLKVKRVGTEKRLEISTPVEVIGEINSLSDSTANNNRLKGQHIQTGSIPADRVVANSFATFDDLASAIDTAADATLVNTKAIEILASDMQWKAEVQTYNGYSAPASPATIAIGYRTWNIGLTTERQRIDFVFPNTTDKDAVDALVIGRKFVIEVPEGTINFNITSHIGGSNASASVTGGFHRERYDGIITPNFTGFTGLSDGNNDYQTTLYRGVKNPIATSGGRTLTSLTATDFTPLVTSANLQAITLSLREGKNIRDYDEIIFRMTGTGVKAEYTARGIEIDTSTTSAQIVLAGIHGTKSLKIQKVGSNGISIINEGAFAPNDLIQVIGVNY